MMSVPFFWLRPRMIMVTSAWLHMPRMVRMLGAPPGV